MMATPDLAKNRGVLGGLLSFSRMFRAAEQYERWVAKLNMAGIADLEDMIIHEAKGCLIGPRDIDVAITTLAQACFRGALTRRDYAVLAEHHPILGAKLRAYRLADATTIEAVIATLRRNADALVR